MNISDFIPYGRANAIPQKQLALLTGQTPREVRRAVFNARRDGEPICSSVDETDGGYFYPAEPREALEYLRTQQSRIKSARTALAAVEKYIEREGCA